MMMQEGLLLESVAKRDDDATVTVVGDQGDFSISSIANHSKYDTPADSLGDEMHQRWTAFWKCVSFDSNVPEIQSEEEWELSAVLKRDPPSILLKDGDDKTEFFLTSRDLKFVPRMPRVKGHTLILDEWFTRSDDVAYASGYVFQAGVKEEEQEPGCSFPLELHFKKL